MPFLKAAGRRRGREQLQNNNDMATDVSITGGLSIADAIKNYNLNFLSTILSGVTQYKAKLKFSKINNTNHTLILVNSNLGGVKINLPAPLNKSAADVTPTAVKLESSATGFNVTLNYDKKLSAALALQNNAQKLQLVGGDIELGGRPAKLPNTPGLIIAGKIPSLNLNDLGKYFSPGAVVAKDRDKTISINSWS